MIKVGTGNNSVNHQLKKLIDHNSKISHCFTIKEYALNNGLSSHIHKNVGHGVVQIRGPLGTGLGINPTGRHVAFAAGTGILAFIDLVGHLILRLAEFPIEFCEPLIDLDKF